MEGRMFCDTGRGRGEGGRTTWLKTSGKKRSGEEKEK